MALSVIPGACLSECWSNDMARAHSEPSGCVPQSVVCAQYQRCLVMGDKWSGPRDRLLSLVLAWPSSQRGYVITVTRSWLATRTIGSACLPCVLELLPVDRTMFAHYALMTLTTIPLHPTRLETWTKKPNMCTNLQVIETHGRNKSKGCLRWLR